MTCCPCCEGSATPAFESEVLGKYRATYSLCDDCGSLHVADPHWLSEAYAIADRDVADSGRGARARAVSQVIRGLADAGVVPAGGRWLDYGAGDGVLGVLLDSQGYRTRSFDTYVKALSSEPEGKFVGCSLVEVIEHTVTPRAVFARLAHFADVVVATVEPYCGQGRNWHYLATDWGQHIVFPSPKGLAICAAAGGFKFHRSFVEPTLSLHMHVLSKAELQMDSYCVSTKVAAPVEVILYNHHHAGDVAMSRAIIVAIVAANPTVKFKLECQVPNTYLWMDLGLPISPPSGVVPDGVSINLHFGSFGDGLKDGLTYRNNVETYNRQAVPLGMVEIEHAKDQRFVELPRPDIGDIAHPAVLVENGVVLSGQPALGINHFLPSLCDQFPAVAFYHSAPVTRARDNLVDVSHWNLSQLAVLSERCQVLICRLSAVMVASFTKVNHGRRRVVFGSPLGCPIWDEEGVVYVKSFKELCSEIEMGAGR